MNVKTFKKSMEYLDEFAAIREWNDLRRRQALALIQGGHGILELRGSFGGYVENYPRLLLGIKITKQYIACSLVIRAAIPIA
jgi:hypothetical protein